MVGSILLLLFKTGVATSLVIDEAQLGPHSWPRAMLIGLIGLGALWGVARWRVVSSKDETTSNLEQCDLVKLILGILSVTTYGAAITLIGFAFSTFLFLLCWLPLGGIRNILTIMVNSALGTCILLYLFLKVAYLPLPRGIGAFDSLTVGFYRILGIY